MPQVFQGTVSINNSSNVETITLDGEHATINVKKVPDGGLSVFAPNGKRVVTIEGRDQGGGIFLGKNWKYQDSAGQGNLFLANVTGNAGVVLSPEPAVQIYSHTNALGGFISASLEPGRLTLGSGTSDHSGKTGDLQIRDAHGNIRILAKASGGGDESFLVFKNSKDEVMCEIGKFNNFYIGGGGRGGDLIVREKTGTLECAKLTHNGDLELGAGPSKGVSGITGNITVRNSAGATTLRIDGGTGDIVFQNADCAEEFDIAASDVEAGMVVVFNEDGAVLPCDNPYDRRVGGVISGAGRYRPALVLDRSGVGRRAPVAVLGKVMCKADADLGAIQIGDLLTTSSTRGHAMKASQAERAFGAVIGKALSSLHSGQGMVTVLVALG